MKKKHLSVLVKVILLQVTFLLLHYVYVWFPNTITGLFSAINESTYQHMKIAFFSYILVSLIEYALFNKRIESRKNFFFARTLSTVLYTLFVIVWYYVSCAYFVKFESVFLEILFANLAVIMTAITTINIELQLEKAEFNRGLKWISVIVFLVTLSEFIIFTHRLPWLDVFANPPGY